MTKKKFKRWFRQQYGRRRGRWQELFALYGLYHPLWFWEV